MAANPIVWFEIYAKDMVRAKAFYEAVLAPHLSDCSIQARVFLRCGVFPASQRQPAPRAHW